MDQRAAYTWDRACGVRYPLGRVTPPDHGDQMLSAMVTADAEIRSGGFPRLFSSFDDLLDIAAEAYAYFGVGEVADALTAMAAGRRRHGAFPDRLDIVGSTKLVSKAFRGCGVPRGSHLGVDEMLELATAHYLDQVSPRLEGLFAQHFEQDRDAFAPPGHPSTWA